MSKTDIDAVQQTITDEHTHLLCPTERLDLTQDSLPGDVEVLEDHDYEYLVKLSL